MEGSGEMTGEPVRIISYDAAWPERFERERAALWSGDLQLALRLCLWWHDEAMPGVP
jgi:GrpB-like predicted nucleotidyltransferase (UPF0157 family)